MFSSRLGNLNADFIWFSFDMCGVGCKIGCKTVIGLRRFRFDRALWSRLKRKGNIDCNFALQCYLGMAMLPDSLVEI